MGACFCSGPKPGHTLCPCEERQSAGETRKVLEAFQRGYELGMIERQRGRHRDRSPEFPNG